MDQILQGMDHVTCYLDDILITGATEREHLANLTEVLRRLSQHGVRLRQEKCRFWQDSVEYLGHLIDAKGLHTTDSKLRAYHVCGIIIILRASRALLKFWWMTCSEVAKYN